MACGCIKDQYQSFCLAIDTKNCKDIIISDLSQWMTDEPYVIPDKQKFTIELPNKSTVDLEFNPTTNTVVNVSDLGNYNCLPNGIYCISTESCGIKYTIFRAIVCQLECKLDNLISKTDVTSDWSKIHEIESLIQSVKVNAELGNSELANKTYKIVDKMLNRLDCECPCK